MYKFAKNVMSVFADLNTKPVFTTGIAAKIVGMKPKTLINYDCSGVVKVKRSESGRRLYSQKDLFKVLIAKKLIQEENLTFQGVCYIFKVMRACYKKEIDLVDVLVDEKDQSEFIDQISL